jgi:hypothetical protein
VSGWSCGTSHAGRGLCTRFGQTRIVVEINLGAFLSISGISRSRCTPDAWPDQSNGCACILFAPPKAGRKEKGSCVNGQEPKAKMRILYSVQTPDFPVFLPPHKSVPDNSCVNAVRVADDIASGYEHWDIRGLGRCIVESMALPLPEDSDESSPSVVALLLPNK